MTWWLKVRAAWAVATTAVATVCLGMLIGNAQLPIPALTGRSGNFLIGHLIPVLPAAVLLYGIGRTDTRLESVAVRSMRTLDSAWALLTTALSAMAAVLAYLLTNQDITLVVGRNIFGYIGIAMLFAALFGPRVAAALTAVVPIALAAAGWTPSGRPQPWAWPLLPATSGVGLVSAVFLLALGIALKLTLPTSVRPRDSRGVHESRTLGPALLEPGNAVLTGGKTVTVERNNRTPILAGRRTRPLGRLSHWPIRRRSADTVSLLE